MMRQIRVTGAPRILTKPAEVDSLESRLWMKFPDGYREYIARFGEGLLGGSFIRVYPPWRIEQELVEWRRRINKYWFWDAGRKILPKDRALECILIGDTVNGDELVFHPNRPDRLFVLPRDGEKVYEAGNDLPAAIEWMCSSGKLTVVITERVFEPFNGRSNDTESSESSGGANDPDEEALDEIIERAKHWSKRHSVRRTIKKELKNHVGKGTSSELASEALILDGGASGTTGLCVVYSIVDKQFGTEIGVFRGCVDDVSMSAVFEPNPENAKKIRRLRKADKSLVHRKK